MSVTPGYRAFMDCWTMSSGLYHALFIDTNRKDLECMKALSSSKTHLLFTVGKGGMAVPHP